MPTGVDYLPASIHVQRGMLTMYTVSDPVESSVNLGDVYVISLFLVVFVMGVGDWGYGVLGLSFKVLMLSGRMGIRLQWRADMVIMLYMITKCEHDTARPKPTRRLAPPREINHLTGR